MEAREQRGLLIAATSKITQKGAVWLVPSQSGNGRYTVSPDATKPHCTCKDHEDLGHECKHIYAVRFVIQRELFEDDEVPQPPLEVPAPTARPSYPQNWPAYNAAQTTEKATLQILLHDLCKTIPEPMELRFGRPRMPLRDGIFCACLKVYSMLSSRRFTSDLEDCQAKGFIDRVPHFNSVLNVFDSEGTAEILTELVARSAEPLAAIESNFAVDSTGFSGCRYDQWHEIKWKNVQPKTYRAWIKAHAMIGTNTNVVTSVRVLDNRSHDINELVPLMDETAKRFQINDVCADKAYLAEWSLQAISDRGANALIPFKSNSVPTRPGVWNKAYHYFMLHRDEFLARYHRRSNVESTFSMIKRKYGDSVKAKNDQSMKCEVLAKFVCHNLSCLIHAMEEFGIDPTFGCTISPTPAHNVDVN